MFAVGCAIAARFVSTPSLNEKTLIEPGSTGLSDGALLPRVFIMTKFVVRRGTDLMGEDSGVELVGLFDLVAERADGLDTMHRQARRCCCRRPAGIGPRYRRWRGSAGRELTVSPCG